MNWTVCSVFALRSSIVLVTVGMIVWLALIPVIEAAEQTILQRSIPFERQGRVFGFAQLVENAASPLTAFLMAPLAEAVFMPLMTDGRGADLDRRLVRHRARPRHRPHVHPGRSRRCRRDGDRLDVALLPAAGGAVWDEGRSDPYRSRVTPESVPVGRGVVEEPKWAAGTVLVWFDQSHLWTSIRQKM